MTLLLAAVFGSTGIAADTGAPPARPAAPTGSRLKELVSLEGIRENQLLGYGLVVGLAGTGDKRQTVFPAQTLANLLERMGVSVNPAALQAKNTAAVMITATLPAFAQPGTRIDVEVAAMGDATNLQGGLLLMTPLKAATGQVFAVAQGPLVTGGFAAGRGGTGQVVNHPTAGRVPQGAIVESAPPSAFAGDHLRLQLRRPDFTTASRIAAAINAKMAARGPSVARAENPSLVLVDLPAAWRERPVEFVSAVEAIRVDPDRAARIVVNEKTGTITMGKELRIAPVSILHGNLTVEIETSFDVSQPNPLAQGETAVAPRVGVGVNAEKARNINLREGATVEDLVQALLAIGSTPRDIIAILQNLNTAGALDAQIEVI
ncbi:MAG: flagellar basal body P-ring protein FlgI [Bryobacteraceae bacterium]